MRFWIIILTDGGGVLPTIDIIALCVIGVFALIGLFRGFIKSVFKTFSLIIIIFVPILICDAVVPLANNWFGEKTEASVISTIHEKDPESASESGFFYEETNFADSKNVKETYMKLGCSEFIAGVATAFTAKSLSSYQTARPIDIFPPFLSRLIIKVITFVALMAITSVILVILRILLTKIVKTFEFIKALDKIGGLTLGIAFGVILYSVVFFALTNLNFSFLSGIQADISAQLIESQKSTSIAFTLSDSFIIEYLKKLFIG